MVLRYTKRSMAATLLLLALFTLTLAAANRVGAGQRDQRAVQEVGWIVQDRNVSGEAIEMVSESDGWMLQPGWKAGQDNHSAYLYRWNGNNWSLFTSLPHTQTVLRAGISMVSPSDGWIVLGGPLGGSSDLAESVIYHWDGSSWDHNVTLQAPNAVSLEAVDMVSTDEGWATGSFNFGTIFYHWDGTNWQKYPERFWGYGGNDVDMISSSDGWSIGLGGIARFDGADWFDYTMTDETQLALEMVSADDGWSVGNNGTILHWNGVSWNQVSSPVDEQLNDISMVSSNDGWIVGDGGVLLHWDGNSWQKALGPSENYPYDLDAVDMVTERIGWATGRFAGVIAYLVQPELTINHASGSPGSYFALEGADFPPNTAAMIVLNGRTLGSVDTDVNGALSFNLSTTTADEGNYSLTVLVNPSATVTFVLDENESEWLELGDGLTIDVPEGIAHNNLVLLPSIVR